jgi:glycosyltransferase involved in cell wall biosynthesis
LNIVTLLSNHTNKGTYWRAFSFGRMLVRRGHNVTILCTSPRGRLRRAQGVVDGVRLVEFPDLLPGALRSGWDLWNTMNRLAWLRGKRFDLVHAIESRPVVIFPALEVKRHGARLFMDWCDWFGKGGSVEERPNPLIRSILRPVETFFEDHYRIRADGIMVINSFLRQRAIGLGVKPEHIRLIRDGSDPTIPVINCRSARQMLGLPTEDPLIGFVGGTYTRDAQFMAAAFNHVLAAVPQAHLILAGYFNRSIEAWVQNPSAIIRSGVVKYRDLYTYMAACNVCWLPLCDSGANRGRWPHKLNDYMTVARPTISTAVGDLVDVIPQYGLGLVTPVDAERFAEETLSLLRDENRAQAIGQAARRAAEEVFDWEILTDELEAFFLGR